MANELTHDSRTTKTGGAHFWLEAHTDGFHVFCEDRAGNVIRLTERGCDTGESAVFSVAAKIVGAQLAPARR